MHIRQFDHDGLGRKHDRADKDGKGAPKICVCVQVAVDAIVTILLSSGF